MSSPLQRKYKAPKSSSSSASAALGHVIVSQGTHRAHLVAAERTLHCQWWCRGQQNQRYAFHTTLSGIHRFQFCDFKHGLFMYMPRIFCCGICESDPHKGASVSQRRVSSLDWTLNPRSTATATLLHRNAASSLHGHVVTERRDRFKSW